MRGGAIEIQDADLRDKVAFDERLTALAELIGSVDRPGEYCVHARTFAPMPRIEVSDIGVLSFPVPAAQLDALIAGSERAPYGRGEDTLVDRSVRDCRQIAPGRIEIGGTTWTGTLGGILDRAAEGLGCPGGALAADFHKLLIYEPGGFFAPHRDTEKADGMVATLTIALPVAGTGGDLVIRHAGRETVVDMRTGEPSELAWTAFYADCEHETLPIAEGHRVCLVYNLVLKPGGNIPAAAPDYAGLVEPAAAELAARCRDPEGSGKLVWLLEHDYSAAGLSFDALKNVDAAVARMLGEAAGRAGCVLHAAVLHVEETGSAEYGGWDREVEDIGDDEYEFVEPIEAACWLEGWVRPDGTPVAWGALPLLPGELMPEGRLDPVRPDAQRLTEATGNVGATIERLYRRAALVAWRADDSPRILSGAGAGSLAAFLSDAWGSSEAAPRVPVGDLALRVVEDWPPPPRLGRADREDWLEQGSATLKLLCAIGNGDAIAGFLDNAVLPHYDPAFNGAIMVAAGNMGARAMGEFLSALAGSALSSGTEGIVDLADRLCRRLDDGRDEAWRDALREMVAVICREMPSVVERPREDGPGGLRVRGLHRAASPLSVETLCRLFALAWRFDLHAEADEVGDFFVGHPELVPPDRTLPALVEALHAEQREEIGTGRAFADLWRHAALCLLSRSENPPRPPADWAMPADPPVLPMRALPRAPPVSAPIPPHGSSASRSARNCVGICATKSGAPASTSAARPRGGGRPYTLICAKTRATHERELRRYRRRYRREMHRLVAVSGAVPDETGIAGTLRVAIGRSR